MADDEKKPAKDTPKPAPQKRVDDPGEWAGFDRRDVAQGDEPQTGRPKLKK